ncbi:protein of unassigned function [Methylobacterium oryzae CBMB20]|uniref:Protein of unassigned function n=1 Tax=Methylobacterium oryzae CBMB20 TaxID=693986 RepID=A0A089NLD6_9HYPH|nr:protein of unassigned function [Methylobacterium oryzae CBMB20]
MCEPGPADAVDHVHLDEAEAIALAYFQAAPRDGWSALVALAADALTERDDLEDRLWRRGQQISRGYVRGRVNA